MWTLDTLPPKAAVHLPVQVGQFSNCGFKKGRGVDALGVYDVYEQPYRMWFCKGKQILHRKHGYGRTPYEIPTPEDSFSSVCLPTLKAAVQYIEDNYYNKTEDKAREQ